MPFIIIKDRCYYASYNNAFTCDYQCFVIENNYNPEKGIGYFRVEDI